MGRDIALAVDVEPHVDPARSGGSSRISKRFDPARACATISTATPAIGTAAAAAAAMAGAAGAWAVAAAAVAVPTDCSAPAWF